MTKRKKSDAVKPPAVVTIGEFKTTRVGGCYCGCCGFQPSEEDEDFHLWRAGICDGDGVFYAALCGLTDATGGCLESILLERDKNLCESGYPAKRQHAADFIARLQGDDYDAAQVEVEDARLSGALDDLAGEVSAKAREHCAPGKSRFEKHGASACDCDPED